MVELLSERRISHDGRRETCVFTFRARTEEEVRKWIEKHVFFQPRVVSMKRDKGLFIAEVESWVD